MTRHLLGTLALASLLNPAIARADEPAGGSAETPAAPPSATSTAAAPVAVEAPGEAAEPGKESAASVRVHGTLEAAYGYNFNAPSNDVTAWRWYDARHDLLGLQNALIATEWEAGPVSGLIELQLGVFTELWWEGSRSPEEDILWRLVQQATTTWQTPHEALSLEGGVFNVPFGPEWNTAYRNWNWSTSNLFALMPYQLGGARLNYELGGGLRARLGIYNGWDQVVTDANDSKSLLASLEWDDEEDEENYVYLNYMVGNERDGDDPRGGRARHTLDLYAQWHTTERLFLRGHVFAGLEPGADAGDGWFGAAVYAKVDLHEVFSIAARGDVVHTFAPSENLFHADTLALVGLDTDLATTLGSGTLTLDYHPAEFVSLRLEARHDRANFPLFFEGEVATGPDGDDLPTARDQTTLTAGLTTWF